MLLLCLLLIFASVSFAEAQDIRVKCNQFTMNVISENTRCYQVDDNIVLDQGASPEALENSQTANTAIYFLDLEYTNSKIQPQVTFYRVDDLGQTSFDLLDSSLALSDIINNLKSSYTTVEVAYQNVPFLPYQAAERTVNILPAQIDFANGTGIRTIVSFSDTISSGSSNFNLYYSWQGLSDDGVYYISAVLPVRSVTLDGKSVSAVDWSKVDGADFVPSLEQLDYYMHSIVID